MGSREKALDVRRHALLTNFGANAGVWFRRKSSLRQALSILTMRRRRTGRDSVKVRSFLRFFDNTF